MGIFLPKGRRSEDSSAAMRRFALLVRAHPIMAAYVSLLVPLTVVAALVFSLWYDTRDNQRELGTQQHQLDVQQDRLAQVADTAQKRGARTDRKQCADIERLKTLARRSTRRGIQTIRNSDLSAADKAEFIAGAEDSLRAFAPQRTTANGEVLVGVASCSALPNSHIAEP